MPPGPVRRFEVMSIALRPSVSPHLMAAAAAILYSAGHSAVKVARVDLDPVALFLGRFGIAVLIVLPLWLLRPPRLRGLGVRGWLLLALISAIRGPGFTILVNYGAEGTSSGMMALLIATSAFHAGWLSTLFLREPPSLRWVLACTIAFGAVALGLYSRTTFTSASLLYPLAIAFAAVLSGLSLLLARGIRNRWGAWEHNTVTLVIGFAMSLPLLSGPVIDQWFAMSPVTLLATVYQGAVLQVLAVFLTFEAVRRIPVAPVAFYQLLSVALAPLWGWILLRESYYLADALTLGFLGLATYVNIGFRKPAVVR